MDNKERIQINIRVTKNMKALYQSAATKVGQTLSAFIKNATYNEADKVLKK